MLSERDSEYVFRKSGIDPSKYKSRIEQALPPKPNETFKVKGFDWLAFLIDCGVGSDRAVGISRTAVYGKLDEFWLDNANRDRIRDKLEVTEESDCLLILQGITKRKLQRLEKLGQEKLLKTLSSSSATDTSKIPSSIQPNSTSANMRRLSPPLIPSPVRQMSPIADKQARSLSLSLPTAQIPVTKNSLKNIPVLKPENSLNSLEITSEPVVKQQLQGGFVTLPDGRIAQQQTTTHYMVRRATTGGDATGIPPMQYQSNGIPSAAYGHNGSIAPSYSQNPYINGSQQQQYYSQMPNMWNGGLPFSTQLHQQPVRPPITVPPPPPPSKHHVPAIVPDPAALAAANADKYSIFRKNDAILSGVILPQPAPSGCQQNPPRPPYTGFGPN